MARKVFISFLGTNNYVQTYYELNGVKTQQPVRFVQEAMIDFLCKNWTENDIILVFRTIEATHKNWLDDGHEKIMEDIEKKGLKNILLNKKLNPKIIDDESVIIHEGFSEKEIWDIFDVVYQKLDLEDEIYFDVTHAFRSIPLFSTVLFNFAKFLKQTKLISIHYGAFEKLGPAFKVKELPLEQRVAPIIDITSLVELQDITSVANNFIQFGRIGNIGNSIFVKGGNDSIAGTIKRLKENIELLDSYILTNRMTDIESGKYVSDIFGNIKSILKMQISTANKKILEKLRDNMNQFVPQKSEQNIRAAIDWAYKYKMIPQSYSLAQEYIITMTCSKLKNTNPFGNTKENIKTFRGYVNAILSINDKDVKTRDFKGDINDYKELSEKLLFETDWIKQLRLVYKTLNDNRNTIMHAKGTDSAKKLESEFIKSYKDSLKILDGVPEECIIE